jgi:Fe-S-cluster-containing dehydrogenase component
MTQKAIITDLNRCVGCLACSTGCKTVNGVDIGEFWVNVLRVGPNEEGDYQGKRPNVEMYYLPMTCQHCQNPPCTDVCPVGATYKNDDGVVVIDADVCIGCGACLSACPYGVRYLNSDKQVAEKCNLCVERTAEGELPQCVLVCGGRARWYGDLDEGLESFVGPCDPTKEGVEIPDDKKGSGVSYDDVHYARVRMIDYIEEFDESDIHTLQDSGNKPQFAYIDRKRTWHEDAANSGA